VSRLGDGLVLRKLLDEGRPARRRSAAEMGAFILAEKFDLILALVAAPENRRVAVVQQREDAGGSRHRRLPRVSGLCH